MKLKNTVAISFLAIVISAIVFFFSNSYRAIPAPRSSSETLSIIKSATFIETYRVKPSGSFGSQRIGDYYVAGRGLSPNPETAKQLKATLVSHLRAEANPHGEKGCVPPEPGVAIRFIRGNESVDILLCFRCYDLFVVNDASSQWRDFMVERDALVKIAKGLFPTDTDI